MGRLIDADKFKKYISESYEEMKGYFKTEKGRTLACQLTKDFMLDIDEQPTAYDVDKVIAELECCEDKAEKNRLNSFGSLRNYYNGKCDAVNTCLGIVKKGLVDGHNNEE